MKVEMLVRRVVDGRVQFSVELVDTYKGDTECVTLTKSHVRLTALAADGHSTKCTSFETTVVPSAAADGSSLLKREHT